MQAIGIDIGGTSVKVAWFDRDRTVCTAHSHRYQNPSRDDICAAISVAMRAPDAPGFPRGTPIGLCLPGLFDHQSRRLTAAVNVPQLVDVSIDDLLAQLFGGPLHPPARVVTDAHAAAHDFAVTNQFSERFFGLSLGTGVGAAVLDRFQPLKVSGNSPGHFGQLDVSLSDDLTHVPVGRDGGRGSLEAYIGLNALVSRYGQDPQTWGDQLAPQCEPIRALVRALRIAHAIYRPQHFALLGGVGLLIAPHIQAIRAAVADQLTSIAKPEWTLSAAAHPFHAAAGAARLAIEHARHNAPAMGATPRA